jgi:hypothetical protein
MKNKIAIISTVLIILILIVSLPLFMLNNKVKAWDNLIYPGVKINNIDLSGKSLNDAKTYINNSLINKIGHKKITITASGITYTLGYKELNIKLDVMDIPKKRHLRPEFQKLMEFLAAALDNDMPVAFLILHNGKVKELDSWHWVTIISIEYDDNQAYADILDEGMIKKINLAEWFNTTIIGGGFVSFNRL